MAAVEDDDFYHHLNSLKTSLNIDEEDYVQNVINTIIQYGDSWNKLIYDIFERYGFLVEIKSLYKFALDMKSKIKRDISISLSDAYFQTRRNRKLFWIFSKHLKNYTDQFSEKVDKFKKTKENGVLQCLNNLELSYKHVVTAACDSANFLIKDQVEYLENELAAMQWKISQEIKANRNFLLKQYHEPFKSRVLIRHFVSEF